MNAELMQFLADVRANLAHVNAWELAQKLLQLVENQIMSQKELAKFFKRSESWVSQLVTAAKGNSWDQEVYILVKNNKLTVWEAYALWKLPENKRNEALKLIRLGKKPTEVISKLKKKKTEKIPKHKDILQRIEDILRPIRNRKDVSFQEAAFINGQLKSLYWLIDLS